MRAENINESILKSITYPAYSTLINLFAEAGKTSGTEQTEERIAYTKLNASRMRRLAKNIRLTDAQSEPLKSLAAKQIWLVIVETWCGDVAQIMPVLNLVAKTSEIIELKIVFRDENKELMDHFLTNGTRSIPKLIVLNAKLEVVNTWGPRPQTATKMLTDYKGEHGKLDAEFRTKLQRWYNDDKGNEIIEELTRIVVDQ